MDFREVLGIIGIVLFFVVTLGLAPTASYFADKKMHRGVSWIRRGAVRRRGVRAQARIVDVQYKTIVGANDMVVEVHRDGTAPYRAEVAETISLAQNHFVLSGMTIAVFVDPDDPRVVVVDVADLDRRVRQKEIEAQEEHARILRGG